MARRDGCIHRTSQKDKPEFAFVFKSSGHVGRGSEARGWEAGACVWHQLTEKGGCQVTGDIPIDEILILSLFCIIYRLDHFSFLFFNITRKSLQIVLKQCKKKMF